MKTSNQCYIDVNKRTKSFLICQYARTFLDKFKIPRSVKKRGVGGGGEKMIPQRGIQQKRGMELIKVVETALLFCFNRCQIDLLDKR